MKKWIFIILLFSPLWMHAQFMDDFEEGNLADWLQLPDSAWSAASVSGRISGNYSLRHTRSVASSGNYTDYISKSIENFSLNEGNALWRFRMKYTYNPTATNKWAIFLMTDKDASEWNGGNYEGYAIGVNQAAGVTDKCLCLYAVKDGVFTEILKTPVNWNDSIGTASATIVSMEIQRSADGEWSLYAGKNTYFDKLEYYGTAISTQYLQANYFGAMNTYTSTSAGGQKLWLDDILISSSTFPSAISTVEQKNTAALLVNFSKALQPTGLLNNENYSLAGDSSLIHPQAVEMLSPTQLQLTFSLLPRGNMLLSVQNLRDENNNAVSDSKNLFIYYNLYGDVVINEIMAKPDPSNGLPEVAYMELFNRLDMPVPLSGWKIEYNTTTGNIGATTIPPKAYMILCSSATLEDMREYGNATTVSYISSLTRTGKMLSLKNNEDLLIHRVNYSDKWIADEVKRDGGWSLEKIDPNNLSETAANWAASTAPEGGTPGRENSVKAANPDKETPSLLEFEMLDNRRLLLTFNEPFDSLQANQHNAYTIDRGMGNPQQIIFNTQEAEQIELIFSSPFIKGVVYELSITAPFCDLAGNIPDIRHAFGDLYMPQKNDIVINEILFHPYSGGNDFVEIYNRSDKIFDLYYLQLANRGGNANIASLRPVPYHYYLYPDDYAVFTTELETLQLFYNVPYPEKVILLPSLPPYPNESGCAVLLGEDGTVIDEFAYTSSMHSGFINRPQGISLERVNPDRSGDETANWQSAAQDAGFATPTYRNSQYNTSESNVSNAFSLPYDVFSPDGDGYRDLLYIDYQMPASGYVASITIYDVQGRLVRILEKNSLLGISGRFAWDGTRHDNHRAALGTYILFIEYYDLNGNMQRIKKTCALATR